MTNNHKVAHDPPPSRLFHSKVLSTNTKLLTSDQTTTAKNISPNSSASEGQCHYRVQLIGSRGFRRLNAKNIRCANHCNLELSVADGKKVLAGMDAVVFILKSNLKGVAAPANPTQAWIYHSRENPRNAGRGFTPSRPRHLDVPPGLCDRRAVWILRTRGAYDKSDKITRRMG